jgi:hypothetical protein
MLTMKLIPELFGVEIRPQGQSRKRVQLEPVKLHSAKTREIAPIPQQDLEIVQRLQQMPSYAKQQER